jgi:hypothetical protein
MSALHQRVDADTPMWCATTCCGARATTCVPPYISQDDFDAIVNSAIETGR